MIIPLYDLKTKEGQLVLESSHGIYAKHAALLDSEKLFRFINFNMNYREKAEENLLAVYFDARLHVIGVSEIFKGTISASIFSPREVLVRGLFLNACSVAIIHNHPSGVTTPSTADIEVTRKMYDACQVFDVQFCDHLIIGGDSYYSVVDHKCTKLWR